MTTILKVYVHKYIPNTHRSIYHMVVCTLKFLWYNIKLAYTYTSLVNIISVSPVYIPVHF